MTLLLLIASAIGLRTTTPATTVDVLETPVRSPEESTMDASNSMEMPAPLVMTPAVLSFSQDQREQVLQDQ